jgi:hypothetical protein
MRMLFPSLASGETMAVGWITDVISAHPVTRDEHILRSGLSANRSNHELVDF